MTSTDTRDVFGLAGTTLEGRFLIERAVAEGGFGVVYKAQQAALERPVALKVLKTPARFEAAARQQFLASFAAEAKTIARITHPNIVLVYDFGVSSMPSGEPAAWMALEWLTGETLDDELTRRRARAEAGRTPAACLELMKPALAALSVVHAAGVAHRDLKPANIMLVPAPGGPTPKLMDFGIAKMMDADEAPGSGQTHTRSSQIAFSPGYASPEQISHGRSGPWTDVHAMGLMLTEMLTDRLPLEGEETSLIFQQIVDRVRPSPGKFGVSVGAWEKVLCRALAISPAERYRDASELLQALEATVTEATVTHAALRQVVAPSATTLPTGDGAHTLGVMSTLPAPVASAVTPIVAPRSNVTTGTPISDDVLPGAPSRRASRAPVYVLGAALALTAIAAVGYRGTMTHSEIPSAATPGVVQVASVVAIPPAASAAPVSTAPVTVAASTPPSPSASTGSAEVTPSATPSRAAPPRHPQPQAGPAPTTPAAAQPGSKPRPPGRVVLE